MANGMYISIVQHIIHDNYTIQRTVAVKQTHSL